MKLLSIIFGFIGNLILAYGQAYCWFNITKKKKNLGTKKNIINSILVIIFTLCIFVIHYMPLKFLRGPFVMITIILFCKLIINRNIKQTIILSFLSQIIVILSESILIAITTLIFHLDLEVITSSEIISIIFDVIIAILIYIMSKIKVFNIIFEWLSKITDSIKINQLFISLLFIICAIWIFCVTIAFKNNIILVAVLNVVISVIYTVIIIFIFNYKNKYNSINFKYNLIMDSLTAQEQLINDYRIVNHENKNNLLTIKQMTNNKKVTGYIESLIKEKKNLNKSIMKESMQLPSIGIRALIYNKLNIMNEKNIKYYLQIDKKINTKKLLSLNNDDIVDICQLLGVFLDNAIEETIKYKNKPINISFFNNNDSFQISISNYYENLKLKSTKGKGRGHGLQLVKRIIDNNSRITHSNSISKDVFTQHINIKL